MAGEMIARAIMEGDDRWRLFSPYELVWAGGRAGRAASQMIFWWMQARDAVQEKIARYRDRARREAQERQLQWEAEIAARKVAEEQRRLEAEAKRVADEEARRAAALEAARLAAERAKQAEEEAARAAAQRLKDAADAAATLMREISEHKAAAAAGHVANVASVEAPPEPPAETKTEGAASALRAETDARA
jgi:hypothetical protein